MYAYLKGVITIIGPDNVVIDVNNVGYYVITPNPYRFTINETTRIYTYQKVREDAIELYGFKTQEEKDLFIKLISVKGIGPKSACAILAVGDISGVVSAIEDNNATYLQKFPKIGPKAAGQIILDLKGKLGGSFTIETNQSLEDAKEALLALGYSNKEISRVAKMLEKEQLSVDEYIKKALQLFLK